MPEQPNLDELRLEARERTLTALEQRRLDKADERAARGRLRALRAEVKRTRRHFKRELDRLYRL